MSDPADEEQKGLPPFWWVWVVAGLMLLVAAALFVFRFVVLEQVPVPGRGP